MAENRCGYDVAGVVHTTPKSVTFLRASVEVQGMGHVECPSCASVSTWSFPDDPPAECWDCGARFHFKRSAVGQ